MAYSSFYGGRKGQPFIFSKTFSSIADMTADTTVFLGQYVLIACTDPNNPQNGKIFKRIKDGTPGVGENYTDYWQQLAKITGPAGPPPAMKIVNYGDFTSEQLNQANQGFQYIVNGSSVTQFLMSTGTISMSSGDFISGSSVSDINYRLLSAFEPVTSSAGQLYTNINSLGLQIPYFVPSPILDTDYSNYFNSPALIQEQQRQNYPLNPRWVFKIPKGKPGSYVTNIRTENFDSSSTATLYYFNQNDQLTQLPNENIPADNALILLCDYIKYSDENEAFNNDDESEDYNPDHQVYTIFLGFFTTIENITLDNGTFTIEMTDGSTNTVDIVYPTNINIGYSSTSSTESKGKSLYITYSDNTQQEIGGFNNAGGLLAGFGLRVFADTVTENGTETTVVRITYTDKVENSDVGTSIFTPSRPLAKYELNPETNTQINTIANLTTQDINENFTINDIINFFNNKKIVMAIDPSGYGNDYRGQLIAITLIKNNVSESQEQGSTPIVTQTEQTYCCVYDNFSQKWISLGTFSAANLSGLLTNIKTGIQITNKNDSNLLDLHSQGGIILYTQEDTNQQIIYDIQDTENVSKVQGTNWYTNDKQQISFSCNNTNKKMIITIAYGNNISNIDNLNANQKDIIQMDENEEKYQMTNNGRIVTDSLSYEDGILSFQLNIGNNNQKFTIQVKTIDKTQYFIIGNNPLEETYYGSQYQIDQEIDTELQEQEEEQEDQSVSSEQQEEEPEG